MVSLLMPPAYVRINEQLRDHLGRESETELKAEGLKSRPGDRAARSMQPFVWHYAVAAEVRQPHREGKGVVMQLFLLLQSCSRRLLAEEKTWAGLTRKGARGRIFN